MPHALSDERFVVLYLLDGHHKLEAYRRIGIDASLIGIFTLRHSWGSPADRGQFVREVVVQLEG